MASATTTEADVSGLICQKRMWGLLSHTHGNSVNNLKEDVERFKSRVGREPGNLDAQQELNKCTRDLAAGEVIADFIRDKIAELSGQIQELRSAAAA